MSSADSKDSTAKSLPKWWLQQRAKTYKKFTDTFWFGSAKQSIAIKKSFRPTTPSLITPVGTKAEGLGNLYLGPIQSIASLQAVQAQESSKIVSNRSLLSEPEALASDLESAKELPPTTSYQRLSLFDHSFLDTDTGKVCSIKKVSGHVAVDVAQIKAGSPVVINCQAGKGRSSTYTQMLLISAYDKLPSEAAEQVRKNRRQAQVPFGFGLKKNLCTQQAGALGNHFIAILAAQTSGDQNPILLQRLLDSSKPIVTKEFLPFLAMDFGNMLKEDRAMALTNFSIVREKILNSKSFDILDELTSDTMIQKHQSDKKTGALYLTNAAILCHNADPKKIVAGKKCAEAALAALPKKPSANLSDAQIVQLFQVSNSLGVTIGEKSALRAIELIKDPYYLGKLAVIITPLFENAMKNGLLPKTAQKLSATYEKLSFEDKYNYVTGMLRSAIQEPLDVARMQLVQEAVDNFKTHDAAPTWLDKLQARLQGKPEPENRLTVTMLKHLNSYPEFSFPTSAAQPVANVPNVPEAAADEAPNLIKLPNAEPTVKLENGLKNEPSVGAEPIQEWIADTAETRISSSMTQQPAPAKQPEPVDDEYRPLA